MPEIIAEMREAVPFYRATDLRFFAFLAAFACNCFFRKGAKTAKKPQKKTDATKCVGGKGPFAQASDDLVSYRSSTKT